MKQIRSKKRKLTERLSRKSTFDAEQRSALLRKLIRAKKWTVEAAADEFNVTRDCVQKWLSGARPISGSSYRILQHLTGMRPLVCAKGFGRD